MAAARLCRRLVEGVVEEGARAVVEERVRLVQLAGGPFLFLSFPIARQNAILLKELHAQSFMRKELLIIHLI